eukprot:196740_1
MSIKSNFISLNYQSSHNNDKQSYLFNIIDTPGYFGFSSETISSFVLADGAVMVIDCINQVGLQTETLLQQAASQNIVPSIFMNKLDKPLLESVLTYNQLYKLLNSSIERSNVIYSLHKRQFITNSHGITPKNGNVSFGSGLYRWGFTVQTFAEMYSSKFGLSVRKLKKKLYGDNYWDETCLKWVKTNATGTLLRGFSEFIIKPIKILHDAIINDMKEVYLPIVQSLRLNISANRLEKIAKISDVLRLVMNKWLPVSNILLDLMINHVPSPVSQSHKYDQLYSGNTYVSMQFTLIKDAIKTFFTNYRRGSFAFCYNIINNYLFDEHNINRCVKVISSIPSAIKKSDYRCSSTVMYISKLIPWPSATNGKFIAFGRVFSGTLKTDDTIHILQSDYQKNKKKDLIGCKIQQIVIMMGKTAETIKECPAGNLCGIIGNDEFMSQNATLSNDLQMLPFRVIPLPTSSLVKMKIQLKNVSKLTTLIEGLKQFSKSDISIQCKTTKTGEYEITATDYIQLKVCFNDLTQNYLKCVSVCMSEPIASYRETINSQTGKNTKYPKICVSKSPNKHSRLYMNAEPLDKTFIDALETGDIFLPCPSERKHWSRKISQEYNWDIFSLRRIWTFGVGCHTKPNCVIDMTKGVQFMNEIKESVVIAFNQIAEGGVLCREPLRGIRFNLMDARIYTSWGYRGNGSPRPQMIPCTKKALFASQIASTPMLMEPIHLVNIVIAIQKQDTVLEILKRHNVQMEQVKIIKNKYVRSMCKIQAFISISELFDVSELLQIDGCGVQMKFEGWKKINSDPFDDNSDANKLLMNVRKWKGMKQKLPVFNDYYDRV